jgi:hypothetical protein
MEWMCHRHLRAAWLAALVAVGGSSQAADPPPAVVAEFTQRVQPLLLNNCAAGACHGGPAAPSPRLVRSFGASRVNRRITLANLRAFLDAVGPRRDPHPLVELLSRRHPATAAAGDFTAPPLTIHQRKTFESWLRAVRASEGGPSAEAGVRLASGTMPTIAPSAEKPNRFQALLDAAAHPIPLPPPQEPQGLILGPIAKPPDDDP